MTQLPPNQRLASQHRWPVVGEQTPLLSSDRWTLTLTGLVCPGRTWSLDELRSLPQANLLIDVHCVTRWSKLQMPFSGVRLNDLLEECEVDAAVEFVSFASRSTRSHTSSLRWDFVRSNDLLIAFAANYQPLSTEHGGPLRLVVPGKYFYKSVKWVTEVAFLQRDQLGYWEAEAGYHNNADPWREERFLASTLCKQETERLLAAKDFASLDLRGIDGAGRSLAGLRAAKALLRNADFSNADLVGADFSSANLSGARFRNANLTSANFRGADLEGADFSGANLSAADLRNASLFGATFTDSDGHLGAVFDADTKLSRRSVETLGDQQQAWLAQQVYSQVESP
ncbi:MAG: molybdopterin-dependent oxidoreductase [Planctomycetales bacterium]|nr:molybdopterin-dependent oxidoreductase [Planctomycetales bacterium]